MPSDPAPGPARANLKLVKSRSGSRRETSPAAPASAGNGSPVSNAQLAILMVIVMETMIFGGLIGALMVLRGESPFWPPPGMPKLPIAVTWINTVVLMASAVTMYRSVRAARGNSARILGRLLLITGMLGITFLAVQGTEWVRLIAQGLRMSTGSYGAMFYTLIGFHAAHVLAAVIWLGFVVIRANRNRYTTGNVRGVELCAMYWYFVCAIWPVLFVLVYLV